MAEIDCIGAKGGKGGEGPGGGFGKKKTSELSATIIVLIGKLEQVHHLLELTTYMTPSSPWFFIRSYLYRVFSVSLRGLFKEVISASSCV